MAPSLRAVPGASRAFLLVAALVLLPLTSGCRFERRPDPRAQQSGDTAVRVTGGPVRDSVRAVVAAFQQALAVGDGSRVVSLSAPGATIVDQEEGIEWHRDGRGALPSALVAGRAGLGWNRAATDFVAWDATALLVERYRATVSGEPVPWTAVETFVLERGADGWRVRHVHRSRGTPAEDATVPDRLVPDRPEPRERDDSPGSPAPREVPR